METSVVSDGLRAPWKTVDRQAPAIGAGASPEAADVIIVGGGVIGAATACFLARDHGLQVTVLERDPTYGRASSALSASSIRQQFSTPVNIALSAWSIEFLRRVPQELSVDGEPPPAIGLVEPGYLYLATREGLAILEAHHAVQQQAGAEIALLTSAQLRQRFPWLQVDDIAGGSLGLRGEGWFDGPALHQAFRRKAIACGARFVEAEAVGFETTGHQAVKNPSMPLPIQQGRSHLLSRVNETPTASNSDNGETLSICPSGLERPTARLSAVRTRDGRRFEGSAFVIAAGAWSAPLAAGLGVVLPVVAKKRDVFVVDSPAAPLHACPLLIDPSGVWFRPEGRGFITGAAPRTQGDGGQGDPDEPPLEAIDHGLFDSVIWPRLAARVPAFEALRVRSAWAGYYEMNTFDHNGLAGALPGWTNAYTACGFSGHGMQQAPAVGSALAALIAGRHAPGPSIEALTPARIGLGKPLLERNVI